MVFIFTVIFMANLDWLSWKLLEVPEYEVHQRLRRLVEKVEPERVIVVFGRLKESDNRRRRRVR